ncbi:MAG: sigma-70 family RNA polymerase sigma factor [Firmicutes bacterium]|nr:sigma-70 family RNA polymerase sigma factor [Bacillota bacterium]
MRFRGKWDRRISICVSEIEILMQLRATKRSRHDVLLYDSIGSDREGNEISLIDILSTDEDDVLDRVQMKVDQAQLQEKFSRLSKRERLVLELRYGLGDNERQTQRQISRLLGISRSYVSRIEKRALSKLQGEMC